MKNVFFLLLISLLSFTVNAQHPRELIRQNHFWWSLNTNAQVSKNWSIIADLHIRRSDFMASNSFYFIRWGAGYTVNKNFSVAAGAGHMWLANKNGASEIFTNENRIYQQFQLNNPIGKVAASSRLRIEERWQQKIVNTELTNKYRYTTRFRYQFAITIPVSKNKMVPSVALGDELLMQAGKDIVYNPFDQNRFFAGLKQQITPSLSFDFGYMLVYQQKLNGYQYNHINTLRWFFYWKPDLRRNHKPAAVAFQMPDEE